MTEVIFENRNVSFAELGEKISNDEVTVLKLTNVVIDGSPFEMRVAKSLRGHRGLKEFSLINVTCSMPYSNLDQMVEMMFLSCKKIEMVHIENTKVSTHALKAAALCDTLKVLLLPNNKAYLTDEDAAVIAQSLAQNKSIRTIDMTGNDMTDLGCAAFCSALEKNVLIETVQLDRGNERISGDLLSEIGTQLSDRPKSAGAA